MDKKEMSIVKRNEDIDYTKMSDSFMKSAMSGEKEKAISMSVHGISGHDKDIIREIVGIYDSIAVEMVPFFESIKAGYRRSIGRSLFSRDADLKREIKSTELAMKDLREFLSVADNFLRARVREVIDLRIQMADAYKETILKLIESRGIELPSLPGVDGNLAIRLESLEEKVEMLLNRTQEGRRY